MSTFSVSVLIVDDETPARELLKHYLRNHLNINIVGEASNGFEAFKMIKELHPQLIFLDIQMPKLTGFEMLDLIENPPLIIFTTAYDQYAIKAFELQTIDYLLKPFLQERFDISVNKAIQQLEMGGLQNPINFSALHKQKDFFSRIAVKDRQQIYVIAIENLIYIEADGDYVKLHTNNGVFLKEKTMKYFEENLPLKQFIRIHRSYIVNVNEINKIELLDKENYRVYLKNKTALKASGTGYKLLKKAVQI